MLKLVRLALLVLLTFLAVVLAIAVASATTGPLEKVVLIAALLGLVAAAVPVRRMGVARS